MEQTGFQLQFPDSFFLAFPLVVILVILPALLLYIVFRRTQLATWLKIVLIPICLFSPLLATVFWPYLITVSGLIGATGGDGTVSYAVIATGLFGDYSEYVWGGITTIIVVFLYKLSGNKNNDRLNTDV